MAELVPATPGDEAGDLSLDPIVREAKDRFERVAEWESKARENFINDMKFAHGDSDNGYQWPNAIRQARDFDSRPCLTMNIIRQHNLQISNQAKQNKSSIKVVGTGNGASQQAADVFKWLFRHIEYQSNAQEAYSLARGFQIDAGLGWLRLATEYESEDSFNQVIKILGVQDPLTVFIDMDCQTKLKSDAKYGLVFDYVPKKDFLESFPQYKTEASQTPLGVAMADDYMMQKDHVALCEYFRKVSKKDQLVSFVDPVTRERKALRKRLMPKGLFAKVANHPLSKTRDVWVDEIEWKLIAGETVIDETIWMGKSIPLIPVIGEEVVIDGLLDRKGHTRAMKDAQRMFNYNASSQVEFVALQGKTPWIAPAKALEEFENMWNTANVVNHSVMVWNHVDDDGNPIPPPMRQEPPTAGPAYQQGMDTAFNQMMMTSGQWQNQMGMQGNERTGKAISERQAQSDTSVFHFQDNFAEALRELAKQIIQLAPKIYDTKQVKQILADDGTTVEIEIDPSAQQAYQEQLSQDDQVVRRIFNPAVGVYDIAADVGPAYGTKRQETVDALTLILTQAPALTGLIGDLLLGAMDFDKAQEAALRLKRMIPPQALGKGPTPQEQALQQQVQALTQALSKSMNAQGIAQVKLAGKDQMRTIDSYKAETDRFKALADALGLDQEGLKQVVQQLIDESLKTSLDPVLEADKTDLSAAKPDDAGPAGEAPAGGEAPPVPGARRAPDGQWYLTDPTRKGKYMRIAPLAQERRAPGA